jgi:hypothetical protein
MEIHVKKQKNPVQSKDKFTCLHGITSKEELRQICSFHNKILTLQLAVIKGKILHGLDI